MAGYLVSGAAVVLATKDGSERYLYRGAPVDAESFKADSIKHALAVGLVSEVEDAEESETPVVPSESWKKEQLETYASEHSVDIGDAKTKADILAAIEAAKQE